MRPLASLALVLACILPLAAEAAEAPRTTTGNPPLPAPGSSRLPLDAMLHHQPHAGDVARREDKRGDDPQAQKHRQAELDALYNDIMARSAPKK